MATNKIFLVLLVILASFASVAPIRVAETNDTGNADTKNAHFSSPCRLKQICPSRPTRFTESEGNTNELWDESEDQFQCIGLAAMKNSLQPKFLALPNYSPAPRLVYVIQGQGLVGLPLPGCQRTYQSATQGSPDLQMGECKKDRYQKLHRISQGDVVAVPAGTVHWVYNDGTENLVAISVTELNHQDNQLNYRSLMILHLAGQKPQAAQGQPIEHQGDMTTNIFKPFDEFLVAEAMNISVDLVRKMQKFDERGLTVSVPDGGIDIIRPEEEREYKSRHGGRNALELDESWCNLRITHNVDSPSEADFYSRLAGRVNYATAHKLPVLKQLKMSAEKGDLHPGAIHVPHYKMNAHTLVYIISGQGEMQIVDHTGNALFDGRVQEGDMIVVPQYFVSMKKADPKCSLEWVSFYTSAVAMETSLVGANSALRGLPLEVISNSYQISCKEVEDLKYNREDYMKLVPPKISA